MPPTIQNFAEATNQLPDAPPATDIAPERFGKDAAALAQFGGALGQVGSKLMETRKRAIESDAVSAGFTDAMLKFSAIDDEEREKYQAELAANPGRAVDVRGISENSKARMEAVIEEQVKAMPTGDAQRAYLERVNPVATRFYLGSVDWENKTRSGAIVSNLGARGNIISQDLMKSPSLAKTVDYLRGMNEDIAAKTGVVLDQDTAQKAKAGLGKQYVSSLFDGLAGGTEADAAYGRNLLKNLPPELQEYVDSQDVRQFENRFDQADRERRLQKSLDEQAQKDALKVNQDKAQNAILADIYAGKATVKDIIHGKGALLDPDKKQQMINVLEARQKEPRTENPENLRRVVDRIYADPEDPMRISSEDQIINMYTRGSLSWAQKQHAMNEFRGRYTSAGQVESEQKKQLFRTANAALVQKDALGMSDPAGQEQMGKFWSYALTEIENAKKEGKPVRELLDANSPKYLGKYIQNYKRSPIEAMREQAARLKNQASQPTNQPPVVPQPKGSVLMLDPSGKRFYIPASNVDKARARGYKEAK
jgi:hypothetical protein